MQTPVELDESKGGEIFLMCASANMAIYAIDITKLEVNGNFVMFHHFIMKYEAVQSSMSSLSFIMFYYYLEGDKDVAYYTTKKCFVQCRNQNTPILLYFL